MRHEDHNREILKGFNNPKREERALSLLDLIELRTFDLDLAAWFVSLVSRGASYITGSGPGGVGKTTTMRTLLSFVPGNLRFAIALPGEVSAIDGVPHCVISNELSDHPPPRTCGVRTCATSSPFRSRAICSWATCTPTA